MKCERIKELMSAYIDNEINEVDKAKFEKHLAQCPECKEEYELLLDIVNECSDIDEVELPEEFREELHSKLLLAKESKSRGLSDFIRKNRWQAIAGTAAAAVLIFALSMNGLNAPKTADQVARGTEPSAEESKGKYSLTADSAATAEENMGIAAAPSEPQIAPTPTLTVAPKIEATRNDALSIAADIAPVDDSGVNRSFTAGLNNREAARKIIKNGNMSLKVTDIQGTINQIAAMAEQLGGYIENSYINDIPEPAAAISPSGEISKEKTTKVGSVTVKVPAVKFDSTFQSIMAMGTVQNQGTDTNDITKQYMDMESRLNNLKVQEKNYQELLSKAQNVEEMLKVETELNRIRTEIDIMMGDLKRWDDMVEYSTIYINLTEVKQAELEKVDTSSVWQRARQGLINTINNIKDGIAWLFVFIISALPYIVIFGAGSALALYWIRKRKK